jgi:HEAT repeats
VVEASAGADPFEGLDFEAVDWAGLTHAYGGAEDVPVLIRSLVSPDPGERSQALGELFGSICHQGTVYPASAPAVPFLARAAVAAPGSRAGIGLLLAAMARQYGEDWSDPATFSGAVRVQIASVSGQLAPLLTDPDPEVRRAMLRVMAVCPPPVVRAACDLRTFDDEDERVRADALLALARVERDWPGLRQRLEESRLDGSPAVRQAAALTLLSRDGLPFPRGTVAILADSIATAGDLWAEPGDESWDRLPGTRLPALAEEPAGEDALGVLETLKHDPDAALDAAARIVAARTGHAIQGAYLADAVFERWRDRDRPVAAVLADYLATASQIKHPAVHLHTLARCAVRIEDPDPVLAAAARPWAGHDDDRTASAAIGALARLRDPGCLELARRAVARRQLRGHDLDAVCEIYGESAAAFLPYLRDQLIEQSAQPRRPGPNDPAADLVRVLPHLGAGALDIVPDLLSLLASGRAAGPSLKALTSFGPALAAAGRRDIAAVIEAAFAAAGTDYDRVPAAIALQAITGDDSLARRLAAEMAARPRWERHTVCHLGWLGPAAAACASRIAEGFSSADPWTAVHAAEAYWKITGEADRCADVLARHVGEQPAGQAAITTLLEMRQLPRQCVHELRRLAYAPHRLAWDGGPGPAAHADDVLRDSARALLHLQEC